MIRAIIFDFDGLILDTESADFLAWREICQAHGCDLSFSTWAQGVGVSLEMFDLRDYLEYLARQHVYSIVSWPRIELLETGQGSPFWSSLYALKARAQATIAHILPEPYAALLTGILLGVETGIPRGLYQQFNATGTSHIIVISGFNIAPRTMAIIATL